MTEPRHRAAPAPAASRTAEPDATPGVLCDVRARAVLPGGRRRFLRFLRSPGSSRSRVARVPAARVAAAVIPVAVAATGSWLGAYAAFTDTVAATSAFSSGTVQLRANGTGGAYAFSALDVSGLVPGGPTTYAALGVSNTGTVPFTWSMSTTATANQLSTDLVLGIALVPGAVCDSATFGAGTVLRAETAGLASATVAGRPLAVATTEHLCFSVRLPVTSSNASAGLTTTATFTFAATT